MVTYLHKIFIACIVVFNANQTSSMNIVKRATGRDVFRPSGKTCIDFCVYTDCNRGKCILDTSTCFTSCVCPSSYTGRWCENSIDDSDNTGNTSTTSLKPSRKRSRTVLVRRKPTISTGQRNNISSNIDAVTISNIVKESNIRLENINETYPANFESRRAYWMECQESCFGNGRCVEVNGRSYNCSYIDSNCGPGLECKHGICQKGFNENRSNFKCLCEYGWIGTFCNEKCSKDCGMHGRCTITDKKIGTINCVCDAHYTGPYCSNLVVLPLEDEIIFHWYVVGACVGIGTILIIMLIVVPLCIWKKRRSFVMRIIHYFQNYEDDDGKTYDAFVSYKSSKMDQDFILKHLYPTLEVQMGFKLCLHFRDFTPGDVIANNIIKAVEDSRRTIMIISQNYIESEWCRMEYQKAQHEMLKMKHKIIPIVLEDISNLKTDKNLKSIINTVTYIEWPGEDDSKKLERFWKQLKLSMPKKQNLSSSNEVQTISSSSSKSFNSSPTYDIDSSSQAVYPSDSFYESNTESTSSNNSSRRIRTLLRNPFRLNIGTDNFKRLSRTSSKDSGVSSPITPSPSSASPLIQKDKNSFLPRKHIDIRHNNSKGLMVKNMTEESHKIMVNDNCNIYNITCEEDKNFSSLIPEKLPDLCKTYSKGCSRMDFVNISGVTTSSSITENFETRRNCETCIHKPDVNSETSKHLDCNTCVSMNAHTTLQNRHCDTCVLGKDDSQANVRQFSKVRSHNDIPEDKILNTSKLINYSDRTKTL